MRSTPPRRSRLLIALGVALASVSAISQGASATPTAPVHWSAVSVPTGSWQSITYGAGRWVLLGDGGMEATSTDGVNWSTQSVFAGTWRAVTYGGGRFVALSSTNTTPHEMISTDGVHWSATAGTPGAWTELTYGNGRFVAIGAPGRAIVSTNATDWSTTFSRRFDRLTGVAFGGGRFVAVDALQGDTIVSTNGVAWAFYPAARGGLHWGSVAFGNGVFVAFDGAGTGTMATSVLGYTWSAHQYSPAQRVDASTFVCGSFIGVGAATSGANNVLASPFGDVWSTSALPVAASADWTAIAVGGRRVIAIDDAGDAMAATAPGVCGLTVPSYPQQVSGNVHSGEIWTYQHPPASSGGASVDGYRVTVTDGTTTKYCYAPVYYEPNCIVSGLINHRVYTVLAQAHNRFGYSAPSDPEFAIPVPVWRLNAQSAAPVVDAATPVVVQMTGVLANSEGIYPISVVTVRAGSRATTCWPNEFGECLVSFSGLPVGPVAMSASYTGYGRSYAAAPTLTRVASVTVAPSAVVSTTVAVTVRGAIPNSLLRVVVGGVGVNARTAATGSANVNIAAPSSPGSFTISVFDAGWRFATRTLNVQP